MKKTVKKLVSATLFAMLAFTLVSFMGYRSGRAATQLPAPTISGKGSTQSTVTLKWKKVSGASGYKIYKYNANKKTYKLIKTVKSKKTVNIDLYTYCISKILVFYKEHNNTLPNYCTYDYRALSGSPSPSPSPTSKYGHATKSGCDNMGQNNGYYCGCHSLQEVFRNLTGIVVPQSTIASWAGTTTSGPGHYGLDTAVAKFNSKYGKNLKVQWYNFSELGWDGINRIIKSNNQDCIIHNLYRNQWGHYEVVNGVSNNITVQNSLGSTCSQGCYCGYIEYRSQAEFRSYINGISQKSVMVITRS